MSTKFKVDVSSVDLKMDGRKVTVSGKNGQMSMEIEYPFISVKKENGVLFIEANKDIGYQKAIAGTIAAKIRNMARGVQEKYTAELALVYMHFPASMKIIGKKLIIENFVGERKAREVDIPDGLEVSVEGTNIVISGIDKYLVGQLAGTIESKVQIKNKDRRVFKDGIFITKKP